ncbi:hypothetical protein B9Z55_027906 [Caenorhabditis nigoni]|nr:hypothetical protein B9Z55_027906 [Caenorhabditis nigoni]
MGIFGRKNTFQFVTASAQKRAGVIGQEMDQVNAAQSTSHSTENEFYTWMEKTKTSSTAGSSMMRRYHRQS